MKTYVLSLCGALLFSFLFYDLEPGLNVLIIACFTILTLVYLRRDEPIPWLPVSAYLYTALFCFIHPGDWAMLVHILSLIVLAGAYAAGPASLYVWGLAGGSNLGAGMLIGLSEGFLRAQNDPVRQPGRILNILIGILLCLLLVWVFASLYAEANPEFAALVDRIDLGFIESGMVLLALVGFALYLNLLRPYDPARVVAIDMGFGNSLPAPEVADSLKQSSALERENLWGLMGLICLNLLLVSYLVLDWNALIQGAPDTPVLQSRSVHSGVEALIFSVVLAIGLLILLFRGGLNYYAHNKRLKAAAFAWMGLNLLLLVTTAIKTLTYVVSYGLTFKRLGVFIFLLLIGYGLITIFIKVRQVRSIAYLLRKNSFSIFCILVFGMALPWNSLITAHNLRFIEDPDIAYLLELHYSNSPQLIRYARAHREELSPETRDAITSRYRAYTEELEGRDWREWTAENLSHPQR